MRYRPHSHTPEGACKVTDVGFPRTCNPLPPGLSALCEPTHSSLPESVATQMPVSRSSVREANEPSEPTCVMRST